MRTKREQKRTESAATQASLLCSLQHLVGPPGRAYQPIGQGPDPGRKAFTKLAKALPAGLFGVESGLRERAVNASLGNFLDPFTIAPPRAGRRPGSR